MVVASTVLLTLGACGGLRTHAVLDRDFKALVGKDVQLIVKRIGYPDRQDVMMNDKVYTWHLNDCTLHVAVDASEHVVRSDYNGSNRECNPMADRIDDNDREYRPKKLKPNPLTAKQ
ncbi:MAG: hypothetical protein ABI356_14545 [Steroidobacteraceae bacterium]